MKKTIIAIAAVCGLVLSNSVFAATNQTVTAFMDGAYQYLGDARANYSQGLFTGVVLANAYESKACFPTNLQQKTVLTAVASVLMRSTDIDKVNDVNAIANVAINTAFPCK